MVMEIVTNPATVTGHTIYDVLVVGLLTLPAIIAAFSSLWNGYKVRQTHEALQHNLEEGKKAHEAIKKAITAIKP